MNAAILNVNGIHKKSTELTYDDLTWLYQNFIDTYGYIPTTNEGKKRYNLPQQRIIKKITSENGHTYNEFINQFGKVKHVRTEDKSKYNEYVDKYKIISTEIGHGLTSVELENNHYGLPCAKWFVDNCPNKDVKSFDDFVQWNGFPSNKTTRNKEDVVNALINLEEKLGRPIIYKDITVEQIGFSSIVVNRIWGNLTNCKEEIGLMPSLNNQPLPFMEYKTKLDMALQEFVNKTDRKIISWRDIENCSIKVEHKAVTKAFKREGIDIFAYIKSKGFLMNPSTYGYHYTFDDGERVLSSFEYIFSLFLKNNGYKYLKDYTRDVMYKTFLFLPEKTKMNCDYVFGDKYLEIAGIINNPNNDWDVRSYRTKTEIAYQNKMIKKRNILESNNKDYLFLFPEDFMDDKYQSKFQQFIHNEEVLYA